MKTSTLLLIISTAAINSVHAGCFSGLKFGAEGTYAKQAVDDFCDPKNHEGFTQDTFNPDQTKAFCFQLSGDKKADFSVRWEGEQKGQSLAQDDCVKRLKAEIDGCKNGGSSTTADWTFTVDPNSGTCDPPEKKREVAFTA